MNALFTKRREWLYELLDEDSVVIVVGNTAKTRSKNINYHFRGDNDLFYLTGFGEQNAVAVFRPGHEKSFVMFTRANDAKAEVSFGARAGVSGVISKYGADDAFIIDEIEQKMPELFEDRSKVYYLDEQGHYQASILTWIHQQRRTTGFDVVKQYRQLLPLQPLIHNKRVVKDEQEIQLIKDAVNASVVAHKEVMKQCRVGMNELQLQAIFDRSIADFGCREVSYPSIVASGDNACCLHYEDNNCELEDGKLLLIDAGAEYKHYCADITRTWPINGKFTEAQAKIYNLVLAALDAAIAKIEPGLSWNIIYETCVEVMVKGLIEFDILKGTVEEVIESGSHLQFTVHKTGHWLGMDVHDVGSYHNEDGSWIKLVPNMVFTIEPGIYIPSDCELVEEKWRGIAIRIEDDILVTGNGYQNLSAQVPRTINEIESIMSKR